MRKKEKFYHKLLATFITTVVTTGCVNLQQYSPRGTSGWKEVDPAHYKYACDGSAVGVYPIQIKSFGHEGKALLSVDIHNSEGIQEACELFFLWLENTKTGQRVNPMKVEKFPSNVKTTTRCFYFFNIHGDKDVQYILHISDQFLDCPIDPMPYVFEEKWEILQDVM